MIREINGKYRALGQRRVEFNDGLKKYFDELTKFRETLEQDIDMETMIAMAKFAEATPKEIRSMKMEGTTHSSEVNSDIFRRNIRLRSNNGYIDLSVLRTGRQLVTDYLDLVEMMLKYSLERFNADRTQTNAHKAICLSRDVGRFNHIMNCYDMEVYDNGKECKPIVWADYEAEGDYLADSFSVTSFRERVLESLQTPKTEGIWFWSLDWYMRDHARAVHLLHEFAIRITEFGEARVELTPEQLDEFDPQD